MATVSQLTNSMNNINIQSAVSAAPSPTGKYTRDSSQGANRDDIILQLLDRVVYLENMVDKLTTKVLPQYAI